MLLERSCVVSLKQQRLCCFLLLGRGRLFWVWMRDTCFCCRSGGLERAGHVFSVGAGDVLFQGTGIHLLTGLPWFALDGPTTKNLTATTKQAKHIINPKYHTPGHRHIPLLWIRSEGVGEAKQLQDTVIGSFWVGSTVDPD